MRGKYQRRREALPQGDVMPYPTRPHQLRISVLDLVMFSGLFLMIGFVLGLASASYIL
jgi:hypothetical protein